MPAGSDAAEAAPQLGRPVGANGEETRPRILTATMRCVAEVGYSKASIRDIARSAEVSSAALYNNFANRCARSVATGTLNRPQQGQVWQALAADARGRRFLNCHGAKNAVRRLSWKASRIS